MKNESESEIRNYRLTIGADLIESMERNKELPAKNRGELISGMLNRFRKNDIEKQLLELGYSWRPSARYWNNGMKEIISILAQRGKQFGHVQEWVREDGKGFFRHSWKFRSKSESLSVMAQMHNDVGTRTGNYNQALDDVNLKWPTDLPHIKEVPLLTN